MKKKTQKPNQTKTKLESMKVLQSRIFYSWVLERTIQWCKISKKGLENMLRGWGQD